MKIEVDGLPTAGREIPISLAEAWAVEAAATSLDARPTRLEGKLFLKRVVKGVTHTDVVVVDLSAEAAAPATCDRCGEAIELVVRTDTRLLYAPEESQGADYDGLSLGDEEDHPVELSEEDLDVGWYQGREIDLGAVLCEALSLEREARVVCADSAECDKRTDAILTGARGSDPRAEGPFAVLGALKKPPKPD